MAIRLVLTAGDGWRESAESWLRGIEACRDVRPTVVLTPQRAQGFYLRGRLVEAGQALLGVRFWTPSDARTFLRGALQVPGRAATVAEQALVARSCAEKLLRGGSRDDEASLRSAAQEPASFLRSFDLLVGAGWSPAQDGAAYGRELAREFAATLDQAGLATQAGLHRCLRETPPLEPKPIARVLVLGFNAAHWPLWDLLQAVCVQAEEVEVALEQPGEFAAKLDDLWIGSWESLAGGTYEFPESDPAPECPFEALAASYEAGEAAAGESEAEIHFLATAELASKVQAITLQALDYLRRPECTRLGIVLPEADAVALGVAQELRKLDIPLDDGTGAIQPGPFETRPWQTWIDLQEEATVRRLVAWLRACEAEGRNAGLPSIPAARAARWIDRALGVSMVDDLDCLSRQLETEGTEARSIALFLRQLVLLPEEGMFAGYLVATREALHRLEWNDLLPLLPENPPAGLENLMLSRRAYLAWLREIADSRKRTRAGNHFYGKVHLLVYGQLAGQRWTHLVLTGLNEDGWPRLAEGDAFVSRYELAELNARARVLNRASAVQGGQGEGHETVAPGRGHCLLPIERQDLALRDLCGALRSTTHAICLAARTLAQGRHLLPSDFFSHAWQVKTGQVLDDTVFRDLAEKTLRRCREHAAFFPAPAADPQLIEPTRLAHTARHDPETPFGRYQFSFATPPEAPIQLSCKEWETALAHPAAVWLERVIGVQAWTEGRLSWNLALGTWTHRWLAAAINADGADAQGLEDRIRAAAEKDWKTIQKRVHEAGIDLYPWWRQVWNQARAVTLALGQSFAAELAGHRALTEVTLPRPLELTLPGGIRRDFQARGRLDLLLVEPAAREISRDPLDLAGCRAWVIDFKTGAASELTAKKLQKGQGVQIALYGLALRALGAEAVSLSVLTPGTKLKRQLTAEELPALPEPFRTLDAMHRTGVFGQSPDEDREHGHAPDYPMTTRSVSAEVLKAKWAIERGGEGA